MSTEDLNITPKQVVGGVTLDEQPKPFSADDKGGMVMSGRGGNNVESDVNSTAWGLLKTSLDYSIFHSLFTYDVNGFVWKLIEDGVENIDLSSATRAISAQGGLEITTTATNGSYTELVSFRSPRYQPNRGHLYSTTTMYPDAETIGANFEFGLGYDGSGVITTGAYFEITDAKIYAVVRSAGTNRSRTDITQAMTDATGLTIADLTKGHLYDIQFQWRGVGNYFFYIDLKLVHEVSLLGTTDYVTMENPQLPCFYKVKNVSAGAVITARSGCVDITSEGGQKGNLTDASKANSSIVTIPNDTNKHHLLLVRVTETFKGDFNTRNSRLLRLTTTAFGKDMVVGFAITRDATAIGGTEGDAAFNAVNPYSSLEFIDMSLKTETEVSFDFTKASVAFQAATTAGSTLTADEPNPDLDLYFSAGDIIALYVANVKTGTGGEAEGLLEFGEEI